MWSIQFWWNVVAILLWLSALVSRSHADDALDAAVVSALHAAGATVQTKGQVGFTHCLTEQTESCINYPNADVLYGGTFFPCGLNGCNKCNFPLHEGATIGMYPQLDTNEAVMWLGYMPPPEVTFSYFGFQEMLYERHNSSLNLSLFEPPAPGEKIPKPTADGRYVVDSTAIEFNQLKMNTYQDPNDHSKTIFAFIMTGNRRVARKITRVMVRAEFPRNAINVAGLPDMFRFDSTEKADTFRNVFRTTRPFGGREGITAWTQSNPMKAWRVTFNTPMPFEGFTDYFPKPLNRSMGYPEIVGNQQAIQAARMDIHTLFGQPDEITRGVPRVYNKEMCIESGTYCWGPLDDSLYVDAKSSADANLTVFDVREDGSKLVVIALDHLRTNWSTFWNFGFFEETGKVISSFYHETNLVKRYGTAFSLIVTKTGGCAGITTGCLEMNASNPLQFQVLNRLYLNPQTKTGPAPTETFMPLFYYYSGNNARVMAKEENIEANAMVLGACGGACVRIAVSLMVMVLLATVMIGWGAVQKRGEYDPIQ